MTLGKKIKLIRALRGLTQKELAEKIGIVDGQIRNYEVGIRNPKPQSLSAIANALEIGTTVLTDIDMTTLGDIKALLFQLDEKVGLQLKGELTENGRLKEGTISIAFDNEYINTFLKEWSDKRYEFEQLDGPTQEKARAGEIADMDIDYEYETYCQYDSGWIVEKGSKGKYKDFEEK